LLRPFAPQGNDPDLLVIIKVMKGNSRLTCEIDGRHDEKSQHDNKQNGNAKLVGRVQQGAHKRHDDQQSRNDGAYRRIKYRLVQQRGTKLETVNIRLKVSFGGIAVDNAVEVLRPVDHAIHSQNQHGDE
jgi:hypothetical protein